MVLFDQLAIQMKIFLRTFVVFRVIRFLLYFCLFSIVFLNCLKAKKSPFDFSHPGPIGFFSFYILNANNSQSLSQFNIPDPTLTFTKVQSTSVTLSWKSAIFPASSTGTYKAFYSLISDLDSVSLIESNGSFTQDYTANLTQITFSNLIPNKYYYFNVIVQSSGSKLNYTKKCVQVFQDSTVTDCSFDPLTIKGTVTTVVGTCGTNGITNGSFTTALLRDPLYLLAQGTNIYLTEGQNSTGACAIRKLDMVNSQVSTFAGIPGSCGYLDSSLTASQFRAPHGIAYDGTNFYVNEFFSGTGGYTVRKISSTNVTTLAGVDNVSGYIDATGSTARFNNPIGMFFDGTSLYVGEVGNCRIRKVDPSTGTVTTYAGKGCPALTDTDGVGTAAMLNGGAGSLDSDGKYLYVAEMSNNRIRKIEISTGNVTTLAGPSNCGTSACASGSADGTGSAASFNSPHSLVYVNKYLFVMDYGSGNLRRINVSTGETTTVTTVTNAFGVTFYNKKLYVSLRAQYCIKSIE